MLIKLHSTSIKQVLAKASLTVKSNPLAGLKTNRPAFVFPWIAILSR